MNLSINNSLCKINLGKFYALIDCFGKAIIIDNLYYIKKNFSKEKKGIYLLNTTRDINYIELSMLFKRYKIIVFLLNNLPYSCRDHYMIEFFLDLKRMNKYRKIAYDKDYIFCLKYILKNVKFSRDLLQDYINNLYDFGKVESYICSLLNCNNYDIGIIDNNLINEDLVYNTFGYI